MPHRLQLPNAVPRHYAPYEVYLLGNWLVLSDLHLPYHDRRAIEIAVRFAKRQKIVGVFLNGDILDSHELSTFDKDPSAPRYQEEIDIGKRFLAWLRGQFPKAEILWKDGNHDLRLASYLLRRAPALFGLELLGMPKIMDFARHGIDHVTDDRVVQFGKLSSIHGHEYRPRIQTPVNPARGLFLRTKGSAFCAHFHQTSEHHEPTITGKPQGCWSTGCLCQLNPPYMPLNKWNLGFAIVDLQRGGKYAMRNLRIVSGAVV